MAALWAPFRPLAALPLPVFASEHEEDDEDVDVDAKKKELEEQLQRDLERLAEERKEGLHRIDWQLAEAVENLHAETVRRANERVAQHQEVLRKLEKRAQLSRSGSGHTQQSYEGSEVGSGSAFGEARHHSTATSHAPSDDETGEQEEEVEEEQTGVWGSLVTFVQSSVEPSASSSLATGLSWIATSSWPGSTNGNRMRSNGFQVASTDAKSEQKTIHSRGAFLEQTMPPQRMPPLQAAHAVSQRTANQALQQRASTRLPPPPPPAPPPFPEDHLAHPRSDFWAHSRPRHGVPPGGWPQPPPSSSAYSGSAVVPPPWQRNWRH